MRINDFFAATAAFALTVAPALAQSASRAVAPLKERSEMGGGSSLLIIAAVVALGVGVYFIARKKKPRSP